MTTRALTRWIGLAALLVATVALPGCSHLRGSCRSDQCDCDSGGTCKSRGGWFSRWRSGACGCSHCGAHRSLAIPDAYPLGSVNRAHYHTMETNAEAADFIFHLNDFVGDTAELTPAGKDHILEVAARMRSAPFPVLIERSENNSDPELDAHRRYIVARVLQDLGIPEADQRTVVSTAYGRGLNSLEAEFDYYRFIFSRGLGGGGAFGNNAGQFGGAGGGFGGGLGFGP